MTPTEWNIYTAVLSGLAGILAANIVSLIKQNKRIEIARKFAFEEGANLSGATLRRKQGEAWNHGFNSGVYLTELDDVIEDAKWAQEEELEMIREELANWSANSDMTLRFYPFQNRNF